MLVKSSDMSVLAKRSWLGKSVAEMKYLVSSGMLSLKQSSPLLPLARQFDYTLQWNRQTDKQTD